MSDLIGRDSLRRIIQMALDRSRADQTEARISTSRWAMTRFANSVIHQSLSSNYVQMRVRAVFGKRVAAGTTTGLDKDAVTKLVDTVAEMARHTDENRDFVSLPSPTVSAQNVAEVYCHSTADCTPEQRAYVAKQIIEESDRIGGTAAGSVFTRAYEHAVMNTLGLDSYYRGTASEALALISVPRGGSGYANAFSADFEAIDGTALGKEAAERAELSRNPIDVPPGDYECVLMPYAASVLVNSLIWSGFWALAYQENRSFLCGRLGEKIAHESVDICDDPLNPSMLVAPYDFEGVPKRRVSLVECGVAKELLYDSYSAHKVGLVSNGYAIGGNEECIGSRMNLAMAPGTASVEEMIAATKRGLLVTRFHYVNYAHLMTATITGMTRDGTFLIENGRVIAPVKNLRFTQSVLEALSNVEMIGHRCKLVDGTLVPALKLTNFHFTSASEF